MFNRREIFKKAHEQARKAKHDFIEIRDQIIARWIERDGATREAATAEYDSWRVWSYQKALSEALRAAYAVARAHAAQEAFKPIIRAVSREDAMRKIKALKAEREALQYAPLGIRISERMRTIDNQLRALQQAA